VHAGLASAVPLSYAGSTSLELKSSDDSQHRLMCIDISQTGDVLCGPNQGLMSVNGIDSNLAGISNDGSNSVVACVDWKLLHLQNKHKRNKIIEGRTDKNVSP